MTSLLRVLLAFGRGVRHFVALIRDDTDLRETYPDHYQATGPEVATQGSVVTSMTGLGHG